jgi:hypothetical protein
MSECPFCRIIENLCDKLEDNKCKELLKEIKEGKLEAKVLIDHIQSNYPREKWLPIVREELEKMKNSQS